jgi:hypothetical protein
MNAKTITITNLSKSPILDYKCKTAAERESTQYADDIDRTISDNKVFEPYRSLA